MQNVENSMVGRDDHRKWLVEDLTRSYSGEPKVIPIVGMGGIGKTTLANKVYNNACIRSHFDVCAWATVSQQHNVKEILFSLLRSTKGGTFDMNDEAELANMLQRSLKGKSYLIVLDDMWKSEAWDAVRLCFPSENKGSGILLTTRNTEVARDAGTENLSLQMDLMGSNECWNLFKSVAFANEALPSEFATIGKQIAEKCHGLPLTIAVVAGLLKFKRAIEDWKSVAKDVKIFREDSEIPAKKLMRSWMAEGFLKLENDLEGEAEKCLQELVDRCLVLICKKSLDGTKIRSCYGICRHSLFKVRGHTLFSVLVTFPGEIWGLMQLRHLKLPRFNLPDCPSGSVDKGRHLDFSNLQTISYLSLDCCTKEVIMGIQNVKELGICGYETDSNRILNNLVHLQQLETLSFIFCFAQFPGTLKKLKLESTFLSWSYLDIITELPNLEVLKLMGFACDGEEWHPNVRGFTRLKLLLIEDYFLEYWRQFSCP
ncbi:hypothetical protein CQW23_06738 [Capsicum baccatum]|uniref:Uncharacterized protein n=1 Tax=Capsicum baccatum TaxID=33114 RepID=A0A2G2X454_CAPBA|nr:hypothetical protein CQW23_06738 [Capsicum baccatum]